MAEDEVVIKFTQQDAESVASAIAGVQEQLNRLAAAFGNVATAEGAASEGAQNLGKETTALGDRMNNTATVSGTLLDQIWMLRNAFYSGQGAARSFGVALNVVRSAMSAATTGLGLTAIGVGAVVGAFEILINKAAGAAAAAYESAKAFSVLGGTTIEKADEMQSAFRLLGENVGSMQGLFFRLAMDIDDGGQKLRKFGIDARDALGQLKAPAQALEEMRAAASRMTDVERLNALQDAFGRAGRSYATLFQHSEDEYQRMKQRAREIGGITTDLGEQVRQYKSKTEELSLVWEAFWLKLAPKAIEILKAQVEEFIRVVEWLDRVGRALDDAAARVQHFIQTVDKAVPFASEFDLFKTPHAMGAEFNAWLRGWLGSMEAARAEAASGWDKWFADFSKSFGESEVGKVAKEWGDKFSAWWKSWNESIDKSRADSLKSWGEWFKSMGDQISNWARRVMGDENVTKLVEFFKQIGNIPSRMKEVVAEATSYSPDPLPGGMDDLEAAAKMSGLREPIQENERKLNEWRLRTRAELLDRIVQMEANAAAETSRIRTDREAPAVKIQIEALERRIAIEQELQNELKRRRALAEELETRGVALPRDLQPEQLEREAVASASKVMALQDELGKNRRKLLEAEMADYRKSLEQRLSEARAFAEREQSVLTYHRDQWVAYLEASTRKQLDLARSTAQLEETYARQTGEARIAGIDKQIEEQRRYAEQFREVGAVQAQVVETIRGLQQQRLDTEMDTNRKIYESRKKLAEQERALALEQAALGGDVEAAARASLEKRGIKRYTQTQLAQEYQNILNQTARYAEQFAQGGALSGEQLDLTRTISGQRRSLANQGISPNEALARSWDVMRRPEMYAGPINVGGMPGVATPEFERMKDAVEGASVSTGSFQKSIDMAATTTNQFVSTLTGAITQIGNTLSQLSSGLAGGPRPEFTKFTAHEGTPAGLPPGGSITVTGPASGHRADAGYIEFPPNTEGPMKGKVFLPKYELGAWRTQGGLAMLHDNEMVLPSGVADRFRDLMAGRDAALSSVAHRRLGGEGLGESYAGAFLVAEREMRGFEDRMRARLRGLNSSVRDHLIQLLKQELPSVLQQQGARR